MATLSFESLRRSRATLEDFVRSYFPLHRMPVDAFLNFMDFLYFVEASIYECDEYNEAEVEAATLVGSSLAPGTDSKLVIPTLEEAEDRSPCFRALISSLKSKGVLDARVQQELQNGLEYWALERKLCAAPLEATTEEASRALSLKSFDYRVLNLLLYQLRGVPYDDAVLSFMREAELLVEIEDDLKDYAKDVVRNSFNIYRTYVHTHHADAATQLATFIEDIEKRYLAKRAKALDPEQLRQHIDRNEEQESAGPVMAPSSGRWDIPVPIIDEGAFRLLAKVSGSIPRLFVPPVSKGSTPSDFATEAAGTKERLRIRRRDSAQSGERVEERVDKGLPPLWSRQRQSP